MSLSRFSAPNRLRDEDTMLPDEPLLTGTEKAWAAFIIGTIVQSLDIVIAYIPPDAVYRLYLLIIVGIVGTVGQGLGVYQIANSLKAPKVPGE